MTHKAHLILLAAGGIKNTPNLATGRFHTSLEWILHAHKKNNISDVTLIGGKDIEDIAKRYPKMNYRFNADWQNTGTVSSLLLAEDILKNHDCIVSYVDVVYRPELVESLLKNASSSITTVIDTLWAQRYPRTKTSLQKAEKIWASQGVIQKAGREAGRHADIAGEYAGIMHIPQNEGKKLIKLCATKKGKWHESASLQKAGMMDLLHLLSKETQVHTLKTEGQWAELDSRQDFHRFIFGTKSQTLERLQPLLKTGVILDQFTFTHGQWKEDPKAVLKGIREEIHESTLIVRSSTLAEDSLESSFAGAFESILNVPQKSNAKLTKAIEEVIKSFGKKENLGNQVLVQPQVQHVTMSGVLFTCDITTGAPYYTVNYDTSGSTDSITAGQDGIQSLCYIYKKSRVKLKDPKLQHLIKCAKEIEKLTGNEAVDIEFAFDKKGTLFIFQARPITSTTALRNYYLHSIEDHLQSAKKTITQSMKRKAHVAGKRTILGDMPDWNPAELIGSHPKPLARSLFEELIMKDAWREARNILGYTNPEPEQLMLTICGHPYIDVRNSLNSYTPKTLPKAIRETFVNEAIDYLALHPDAHDKLEFEVAVTCFSPVIHERIPRWKKAGLKKKEIDALLHHSKVHTESIIRGEFFSPKELIDMVYELDKRRKDILKKKTANNLKDVIEFLLDDCRKLGTIPFSCLARMAFISQTFLKAFREKGSISKKTYDEFLLSIHTVSSELGEQLDAVNDGSMKLAAFLKQYGHLRPGTYEIQSYRYDEKPDLYFEKNVKAKKGMQKEEHTFKWKPQERKNVEKVLKESGMSLDIDELFSFIRQSIEWREEAKFIYSRNISDLLLIITEWGKSIGIPREDLSFLTIQEVVHIFTQKNQKETAMKMIAKAKKEYELHQQVIMPQLITQVDDIHYVTVDTSRPNFITNKHICASTVYLEGSTAKEIDGKIVLIESADPGYDWIFTHEIKGLITKYGGAGSHMAIRSAEFGLPAAIGVGAMFEQLTQKTKIDLNCANQKIT